MRQLHSSAEAVDWLRSRVTGTLQTDSRLVGPGDGFIAWPGAATDGRQYVPQALDQGASACLVEHDGLASFRLDGASIASCADLKAATGPIASMYFDEPSHAIEVLAVTGTNGKTSTAWWLAQALSNLSAGRAMPCAVVGTLGVGQPPDLQFNGMTTPDPVLLQRQFRRFVDGGIKACAIEASSIGLAERRLDGTRISVAIFTNFTQDHLDYHGSMDTYWLAKRELFDWQRLRAAVINLDDPKGASLAEDLRRRGVQVWTYGIDHAADLAADKLQMDGMGLRFDVSERSDSRPFRLRAVGRFNVSNVLAVLAAMRAVGISLADAVGACEALTPVPGRLECVETEGGPMVVVDYAHTPDALDKALGSLRPVAAGRGGRLWCVFGCGGGRDPTKRPLMGAVAEGAADHLVLTSDNPRNESPESIVQQITGGLQSPLQAHVELDRGRAIAWSLEHAEPSDIVLIAGKGHEQYQETQGVRFPFSDQRHALDILQRMKVLAGGMEVRS